MEISDYTFLLPAATAFGLAVYSAVSESNTYKLLRFNAGKRRKRHGFLPFSLYKAVSIPDDSFISRFYTTRILRYSKLHMEELLGLKTYIFVISLVILLLVKYTNITVQTKEIFSRFDYRADLIYQYNKTEIDEKEAMRQETAYLRAAMQNIKRKELAEAAEDVQQRIKSLMPAGDRELVLPKDTVANKIYHRLRDYYAIRKLNLFLYIIAAGLLSFLPELFYGVKNTFVKADAKRELHFLKKLIIMNGSIKPVNFNEVLKILIEKSKYYRHMLEELEDRNSKNSVDKKTLYAPYIKNSAGMEEKLFFEKLDEANNYDFDQAIRNIENEFRLEQREAARKIRKRIEAIHVAGILGFMIIIFVMVLYMIVPWIQAYNMNQIGF